MSARLTVSILRLLLLAASSLRAQPCPVTWDPTFQISNTPNSAFSPKLAVVGDTVHVVYDAGDLFYQRSVDAGNSWGPQIVLVSDDSIGQIFNRPLAASGNDAYFVWGNSTPSGGISSIKLRRSTDGGETWLDPQVITQQDPLRGFFSPMVAVSRESLYVAVAGFVPGATQIFLSGSTDGGATWDSVRQITSGFGHGISDFVASRGTLHLAVGWSQINWGQEVAYMMSSDGGGTWSSEEQLSTTDSIASWEPNVAADGAGNVYFTWQDAKYGTFGFTGTVLLCKSTDDGFTWLPEVIVSDLPSAERSSLSVDQNVVHVVWEDERAGVLNRTIQYRGSTDGGLTWCPEYTVGDTLEILTGGEVASCSGTVHTSFSSYLNSGGNASIYYRSGSYSVTEVSEELGGGEYPMSSARLLGNFPNPFNAQTRILYTIPQRTHVQLSLFDLLGREVLVLKDEVSEAGTRGVTLKAEGFSTGVYYVVLLTGATKEVTPIVLLR